MNFAEINTFQKHDYQRNRHQFYDGNKNSHMRNGFVQQPPPLLNSEIGLFGPAHFQPQINMRHTQNRFPAKESFGVFHSNIQHWDGGGHRPDYNRPRRNFQPHTMVKAPEVNMKSFENIPVTQSGPNWTPVEPLQCFTDLEDLDDGLRKCIEMRGYTQPTPVQKYALKIVTANRDLMACAQTGSGKTAAFLLPIFNIILKTGLVNSEIVENRMAKPLMLVLAPTRELCCQIFEEALKFSKETSITSCVVYGGTPVHVQRNNLARGAHILVATPGRLIDMLQQGCVDLSQIKFLVLDEADRMLDMGFEPQIRQIVSEFKMPLAQDRQTLMFSATFPKEIQDLASDFMKNYVFLSVGRVGSTNENITQEILSVEEHEKQAMLVQILQCEEPGNLVLVFVATKRSADDLWNFLDRCHFSVSAIHGARDQNNRNKALSLFRNGRTPILVATAVAARGLDIPNVRHVINFDLPSDIEEYVHRIGRTGRIGADGKATSFYTASKNRNIVNSLVALLQEAKQPVPPFLLADSQTGNYRGGGGRNSYGGGRGGGRYNNGRGNRFSQVPQTGGRDNRQYMGGNATQDYRTGHKANTSFVNAGYLQNQRQGSYASQQPNNMRIGHFNQQAAMIAALMPNGGQNPAGSGAATAEGNQMMDLNAAAAATYFNMMQHKTPNDFYAGAQTSQPPPSSHYYGQVDYYNQNGSTSNGYVNGPPPPNYYNPGIFGGNNGGSSQNASNGNSGHHSGANGAMYISSGAPPTYNGAPAGMMGGAEGGPANGMEWYGMHLAQNTPQ
ncbi:ATP-dependent RNA helicase ddx3x [Cichlidogyrus casuarinus]|uniref:RNA helicase n=1 Tax=Cichlidogyrus casuarinus TaxID=1844966 RepID=A0ABD2Q712_9PLAT